MKHARASIFLALVLGILLTGCGGGGAGGGSGGDSNAASNRTAQRIVLSKPEAASFAGAKCVYIDMSKGLSAVAADDNCTQDVSAPPGSPLWYRATSGSYNEAQCIAVKGLLGCQVNRRQFAEGRTPWQSLLGSGSSSSASPQPAPTTVEGDSSSGSASSPVGTCVGSVDAPAQNLRISTDDRAALLAAYKANWPSRVHDRGPVAGSVYFGRVAGEEWAVATFGGQAAELGDQPEAFKRPAGQSAWTDLGDNAPLLPLPCSLLRIWHLTTWPSYASG